MSSPTLTDSAETHSDAVSLNDPQQRSASRGAAAAAESAAPSIAPADVLHSAAGRGPEGERSRQDNNLLIRAFWVFWCLTTMLTGVLAGYMVSHSIMLGRFFNWYLETGNTDLL